MIRIIKFDLFITFGNLNLKKVLFDVLTATDDQEASAFSQPCSICATVSGAYFKEVERPCSL